MYIRIWDAIDDHTLPYYRRVTEKSPFRRYQKLFSMLSNDRLPFTAHKWAANFKSPTGQM